MRPVTRVTVVLMTLLGCVGCDQASKSLARSFLEIGGTKTMFHDALRLQLTENAGAFLSLGASLSNDLRFALFIAAIGVLLMGLVMVALFARRLQPWKIVAILLIAGGGTSNLFDRIIHNGRVTDFINVGIGSLRTGIFNFADMAIMAGAILLIVGNHVAAASHDRIERTRGSGSKRH